MAVASVKITQRRCCENVFLSPRTSTLSHLFPPPASPAFNARGFGERGRPSQRLQRLHRRRRRPLQVSQSQRPIAMLVGSHFGWQAQLPNPVQKFKPEIPPWSIQTFPTAFGSSLVHDVGDQASLGVVGGDPFSQNHREYTSGLFCIHSTCR